MKDLQIINVCDDSFTLYEYCRENGYTDLEYDEWMDRGGELEFFEGDPDMIKLDGDTGYFALCGDKVFVYFDDFMGKAAGVLRDFFKGGYMSHCGYYHKFIPAKRFPEGCQTWQAWEQMRNAIAYRGGCGYYYNFLPLAA